METCTRCHAHTATVHRAIDEQDGSKPLCGMCTLVLVGDLTRSGVAVTLVVDRPIAATNRGW